MWVRGDDWGRIWRRLEDLETHQRDSVPGDVYSASLERIRELERRVDWQADMLLRRGGTFPVPPVKPEAPQPEPEPPKPSETAIAQAEAIVIAGRQANASREEIERAVTEQTGLLGQELAAVMNARGM